MFKVEGTPKFDTIMLGNLTVNRVDQPTDLVVAKFALLKASTHQSMGWTQLEGRGFLSDKSKTLLAQLIESLEHDAAHTLYEIDKQLKENGDGYEPKGLVDATEEADQI